MVKNFCLSAHIAVACSLLVIVPVTRTVAAESSNTQRPLQVDDLFEMEGIGLFYSGPVAFSKDGRQLAITRLRPKKTLRNFKWEYLVNAAGDVWIQMKAGEPLLNVTNGAVDGSGWWAPQWSEDGTKLAMLSTRGGNVNLWMWDVGTRTLRQLSKRGVDVYIGRPYLWVGNEQVLFPGLPASQRPQPMRIETQTPAIAASIWPKVSAGREITSSVLRSGKNADSADESNAQLVLADVATSSERIVASGKTSSWLPSPDGHLLAFLRSTEIYMPRADEPLRQDRSDYSSLVLTTVDGNKLPLPAGNDSDVIARTLSWSPDGTRLAYFRYGESANAPLRLHILNVGSGEVTTVSMAQLNAEMLLDERPAIHWIHGAEMVFRAATSSSATTTDRRDWWRVRSDGSLVCLTGTRSTPFDDFFLEYRAGSFITTAAGRFWLVDSRTGSVRDLLPGFHQHLDQVVWPQRPAWGMQMSSSDRVLFSAHTGNLAAIYSLAIESLRTQRTRVPAEGASLLGSDSLVTSAVWMVNDRRGLRLWRTNLVNGEQEELATANNFLRNIEEGATRTIEYTSSRGKKLRGALLLPVDYVAGRRYPLVTWVYAGYEIGSDPPEIFSLANSEAFNLQLLASHGYAVLFPSMPLAPEGAKDDPLMRLPDGVLPAVDAAIGMGIADPDRLFLLGHSFGGFSAMGLVTQTHRFKAAVALAGISDLTSFYGEFDARMRYTDRPQEMFFNPGSMEQGQGRMGVPPWVDAERYRRNSPISYVHDVQTPLMIMQGDLDYVPIQQGEEFFTSLYREGKPAVFVRYWGEGHVLESPANIKDMWQRIFDWFAEWDKPSASALAERNQ